MQLAFFTQRIGCERERFVLKGREAWALARLIDAGSTGCTPIIEPAPRWSAYIHKLRNRGLEIETITEPHGGQFPGNHARYVLRSHVEKVAKV